MAVPASVQVWKQIFLCSIIFIEIYNEYNNVKVEYKMMEHKVQQQHHQPDEEK